MSQTLVVTGAAGYLASWIVAQLLEQGHTVHGTVRSLAEPDKLAHLQELSKRHPGQLHLFEADLLTPGSFDTAMTGCEVVIHTASPYFLEQPKDVEAELVRPAREGTLNVLASVERSPSVRRVVLTSSVAAMYRSARDLVGVPGHQVSEADINSNQNPQYGSYAYSKTVAEQAAWAAQRKQTRWDMVSVHPAGIFGPSLSRRGDATSVGMMIQFLNGSFRTGVPHLPMGIVDVRDAAAVHVAAALKPAAHGRYLAVGESLHLIDLARQMRVKDFGLPDKLPRHEVPKALIWLIAPLVGLQREYVSDNVGYDVRFDARRSREELGVQYRSTAETLNDHIQQIVADGLIKT